MTAWWFVGILGGSVLAVDWFLDIPPVLAVAALFALIVAAFAIGANALVVARRNNVSWPKAIWISARTFFRTLFELFP